MVDGNNYAVFVMRVLMFKLTGSFLGWLVHMSFTRLLYRNGFLFSGANNFTLAHFFREVACKHFLVLRVKNLIKIPQLAAIKFFFLVDIHELLHWRIGQLWRNLTICL